MNGSKAARLRSKFSKKVYEAMTEKKYLIDNAELMAEWDWERNNELKFDPQTLTLGSGRKAWWKCSQGHEWQTMIYDRNNGKGCPYCAGKKF